MAAAGPTRLARRNTAAVTVKTVWPRESEAAVPQDRMERAVVERTMALVSMAAGVVMEVAVATERTVRGSWAGRVEMLTGTSVPVALVEHSAVLEPWVVVAAVAGNMVRDTAETAVLELNGIPHTDRGVAAGVPSMRAARSVPVVFMAAAVRAAYRGRALRASSWSVGSRRPRMPRQTP
jgi:hypothetical protein